MVGPNRGLGLRGWLGPSSLGDQAVGLGDAVTVEIEQGLLVEVAVIEVEAGQDHLIAGRDRLGDDLSRRGDDDGLGQGIDPFLDTPLGDPDHVRSVLIGPGLHHQVVVECLKGVLLRIGGVVERGVVADQDQLGALQAHHPIGLGPAAVVADRHSHHAIKGSPDRELGARLEEVALGVLERPPGLVVLVPGDVDLSVSPDDGPVRVRPGSGCCGDG